MTSSRPTSGVYRPAASVSAETTTPTTKYAASVGMTTRTPRPPLRMSSNGGSKVGTTPWSSSAGGSYLLRSTTPHSSPFTSNGRRKNYQTGITSAASVANQTTDRTGLEVAEVLVTEHRTQTHIDFAHRLSAFVNRFTTVILQDYRWIDLWTVWPV